MKKIAFSERNWEGFPLREVSGYAINLEGFDLCLHQPVRETEIGAPVRKKKGWMVSHPGTGAYVGGVQNTQEQAIASAKVQIENSGGFGKLQSIIDRVLARQAEGLV